MEAQGTGDLTLSLCGAPAAFASGFVKQSAGFHVLANIATAVAAGLLVFAWLTLADCAGSGATGSMSRCRSAGDEHAGAAGVLGIVHRRLGRCEQLDRIDESDLVREPDADRDLDRHTVERDGLGRVAAQALGDLEGQARRSTSTSNTAKELSPTRATTSFLRHEPESVAAIARRTCRRPSLAVLVLDGVDVVDAEHDQTGLVRLEVASAVVELATGSASSPMDRLRALGRAAARARVARHVPAARAMPGRGRRSGRVLAASRRLCHHRLVAGDRLRRERAGRVSHIASASRVPSTLHGGEADRLHAAGLDRATG